MRDRMAPQQPVGHAAAAGGGGRAVEGECGIGGPARAVVGRRHERGAAGAHHVAQDRALQQHERDDAQDERQHPRKQQIEENGAVVREFASYVVVPGSILGQGRRNANGPMGSGRWDQGSGPKRFGPSVPRMQPSSMIAQIRPTNDSTNRIDATSMARTVQK